MKRVLKVVAVVAAVPVIWAAIFMLYLSSWGNITARQLIALYDRTGYPQNGIVLMGSSSIQVWTDSEADLGPLNTVNVGIGGTVVESWNPLLDKLIFPFNPQGVVIYIGANDLHNDRTPPAQIMDELQALLIRLHEGLPDSKLYFVSVYSTGAHANMQENDRELNRLVQDFALQQDYLEYIDCATPLLDSEGKIRNDVFLDDLVHLNDTGYQIWSEVIRAALLADFTVKEDLTV